MKKCSKCGFENNDENQFCGKCGTSLSIDKNDNAVCKGCGKEYDASLKFCPFCGLKSEKVHKSKTLPLIIILILIIAVITVVVLIIPKGTSTNSTADLSTNSTTDTLSTVEEEGLSSETELLEINPDAFCTISFSGYNGHGEASFYTNKSDLSYLLDGEEYSRLSNSDKLKIQNVVENMNAKITAKNISNGNTVTVNLDYDKAALEELGVSFSCDSLKYTASGLMDMTKINPFENTTLRTSGLSGNVTIDSIDYSDSPYAWLLDEYTTVSYSTKSGNQSGYLVGGDVITVRFNYDKEVLGAMGYELTQNSGDYTVNCLEPLTYETLMWCDKSQLKAAFDNEAYALLDSQTVRKYVTSITPYAYVYTPAIPERYIYTTDNPDSYLDCCAVAIYSSTDGRGNESYLAVAFKDVWYRSDGGFEYTLRPNNGSGYDAYVEADIVKWIAGDTSPEKMTKAWIDHFEGRREGFTLCEYASTGIIENKSEAYLIAPDDNHNEIPSFDLVFGTNVMKALSRISEYLKASDTFISYYPECADMGVDEIAQNLYEGKYCDSCYFSGDYLYMTAAGENGYIVYAQILKYDLKSYFSRDVAVYFDSTN